MRANVSRVALVPILLFLTTAPAAAGPFADDLSKCLVTSSSAEDREVFVRWMFAAVSAHPAVEDLTSVTPEQLESASRDMGALMTKLVVETCGEEARNAVEYEGEAVLQGAFQLFGTVAGQELFNSPAVAEAVGAFEEHIDIDDWSQALEEGADP